MSAPWAVFLDRDGTLIEDPGYLSTPEQVRLLPGVGGALVSLRAAGAHLIVATNQSGIARGLLTGEQYLATSRRLEELLAAEGAHLDAQYHCPHHPEFTGPCQCRKPGTALYRAAADQFGLDLAGSWWVGDRDRDVLPARALGGRGIILLGPAGRAGAEPAPQDPVTTAPDLATAARRIVAARRLEAR